MKESSPVSSRHPDPADVHVGRRVCQRREERNMTQDELGTGVGVSFQQIQKYENGSNRISAGRLYRIATVLRTRIEYFFEGLPSPLLGPAPKAGGRAKSRQRLRLEQLAASPIGTKTTFSYGSFTSPKAAQNLVNQIGQSGRAKISITSSGTVVKKVAEP